tara:strand:- start:751 stop:906 length:156 start_codon:yes stop_codon:yes gene_type:complete
MATKREALNACGRLKKGYKFRKGGKIVTAGKGKPKATRRRTRRRATQASLF